MNDTSNEFTVKAVKEGEVAKEIDNINRSLESLGKNIETLAARIHPACNFKTIQGHGEPKEELISLCPLASAIREKDLFVMELSTKIKSLIDAVQL